MEKEHILLLIFSFFVLKPIASAHHDCLPASCSSREPEVRFPFRLLGRQPARCGFPGFDLSCDEQNQTILRLPSSLSYVVNQISYVQQIHFLQLLTELQFQEPRHAIPLPGQRKLFRGCYADQSSLSCIRASELYGYENDRGGEMELMWFSPYCKSCEREGKVCRLKSDDGRTICGSSSRGISRSAKYGLSIGIGVPTLICIIGLACYASSKVQERNDSHNQSIDLPSIPHIPQQATRTGLDMSTIESYPKIVFGESCRLPNDDSTCAICLSDYKPKESLRTIPECNHYFHSECIDEWLKSHSQTLDLDRSPDTFLKTDRIRIIFGGPGHSTLDPDQFAYKHKSQIFPDNICMMKDAFDVTNLHSSILQEELIRAKSDANSSICCKIDTDLKEELNIDEHDFRDLPQQLDMLHNSCDEGYQETERTLCKLSGRKRGGKF
ncbi:hypothetical protein L2E82_06504 [Cichorium intybus]|uniref:Uncharacterized protein n=1 Tax=Cichorium intybus TaxID=13427 RepID=A0ACB9HA92_CICIN|nr:hypothetical protein L2E82_06504 [Cichorium intybus]